MMLTAFDFLEHTTEALKTHLFILIFTLAISYDDGQGFVLLCISFHFIVIELYNNGKRLS